MIVVAYKQLKFSVFNQAILHDESKAKENIFRKWYLKLKEKMSANIKEVISCSRAIKLKLKL